MVLPPPSTMVDTTYECRDAALHAPVEVPVRLALDPVMRQAEHRGEVGFGGHLDGGRAEDTRNCVRPLARTVAASGRLYLAIGIRGLGLPGSRSVITPRLAWDAHSRSARFRSLAPTCVGRPEQDARRACGSGPGSCRKPRRPEDHCTD